MDFPYSSLAPGVTQAQIDRELGEAEDEHDCPPEANCEECDGEAKKDFRRR